MYMDIRLLNNNNLLKNIKPIWKNATQHDFSSSKVNTVWINQKNIYLITKLKKKSWNSWLILTGAHSFCYCFSIILLLQFNNMEFYHELFLTLYLLLSKRAVIGDVYMGKRHVDDNPSVWSWWRCVRKNKRAWRRRQYLVQIQNLTQYYQYV